ncbi:MAG: hypothetical protein ACP5RD_06600 [bacterium]
MRDKIRKFKASAMIYSLIFLYVTSLIAIGLINLFESQLKLGASKIRLEQRLKLADSGIDIAISFLKNNGVPNINALKEFNNKIYQFGNYELKVYIFDKDTVKNTVLSTSTSIKDIEDELIKNGVNNFLTKLNSQNVSNTAELPYLVVSKVRASKGDDLYKIALVNLEYFSRYMYFTNSEGTPGDIATFSIGRDVFNGPVRTNSSLVKWGIKHKFYESNNYKKPTFKSFTFTGDKLFGDNSISSGVIIDTYPNTVPATEDKLKQIIEGGSVNFKANAEKVDLASKLTSEDYIKNQIWPGFDKDIQDNTIPQDKGIFIKTDSNSNIVSALLINPEEDNKIYSLDLKVVQNVQAYQIKFEKDNNEEDITIYKVDNTNFNIPSNGITNGITNPNFKVKVINNLNPNSSINLMSYFEDESSFENQGSNYNVSGKALVLTRIKDNYKQVVVIKLDNNKSFPKNVIWVNGSIGDRLEEDNMDGGISGEYNEPLTIIAKPAAKRNANNFDDNYDIRIKGNIIPYALNINPNNNSIPALDKEDNRIMGLYADRIFIGTKSGGNLLPDSNGKKHLYIYSSIMALKAIDSDNINGYFQVEKVNDNSIWPDINSRYLHIYGGLTQCYRGIVGGIGISEFDSICTYGFTKDYNYDSRLAYMNPPYFPTTGEYIVLFQKVLTKY